MSRWLAIVSLSLGCCSYLVAQQPQSGVSSATTPGYTLHANAETVLTDVTVTDKDGNPVHNLPESAFHIFDDSHPQQITSFEEHTGDAAAPQIAAQVGAHTFSNAFLLHPPPAFNVIVLDTWTIDIIDQMYLNQELTKFIHALPANQLLAIYSFAGENAIQVQGFTSDHQLLLAALHKSVPRLHQPADDFLRDPDLAALQQIANDLSQYPGRKNLLWFSSGSPLMLRPDPTTESSHNLQIVYDVLNSERIAMYPIDARGLEVYPAPASTWQRLRMSDEAQSTGGHAYFNTNGLEQVAAHIVSTSGDFYTLSYSPPNVKLDNKWHKVKVKLERGDYSLSYRSGYYDDGTSVREPPKRDRTLLRANGETVHLPENRGEPIIFKVEAQPASAYVSKVMPDTNTVQAAPRKNETSYTFRYTVPVKDFNVQPIAGGDRVKIGAGILVYNQYGRPVRRVSQGFTLSFHNEDGSSAPHGVLSFDQQIDLHKGEDHILVAVWDLETGRLGTSQFALNVEKEERVKH